MNTQTLRAILASSCESTTETMTCDDYQKFFYRLAREHRDFGKIPEAEVASMLGGICSMMFSSSRTGNPWGPMWTDYNAGRRSLEADDLEKEHLQALSEVVLEIENPELRARIADILWTRKQGYQFGQMAVTAYCEDENRAETANDPRERIWRLERAASIARNLGRAKPLHLSIFDRLERLLEAIAEDPGNGPHLPHLINIIYDHQLGNPDHYSVQCEHYAKQASQQNDWELSYEFWMLAATWNHRRGDEDEALRCRQAAAMELIARGRDLEGRKRYGDGYSAGCLQRGLTALKNCGAERAVIDELNAELAKLQRKARQELQKFDLMPEDYVEAYKTGLAKHVESLEALLAGESIQGAIILFCRIIDPTNIKQLGQKTAKSGANLTHIFPIVAVDHEGKEIDRPEGIGLNQQPNESDVLKHLYQQARTITWPIACDLHIEPGRRIILSEHAPRIKDLVFLVSNNPFITPGHESLVLRGIHAGFDGDFVLATHLLVPQFESSLRHYLRQCNVITWVMKDGLQKEIDLGGLLALPKTKELFGEDLVFDLRGILTEKFGENIRNDMAHGNMSETAFFSSAGPLYFWWLFLRMIWIAYDAGTKVRPEDSSNQ